VDPRAGLHEIEKRNFLTLPGLELRPLGLPARSQSLYRLRYVTILCNHLQKVYIVVLWVMTSRGLIRGCQSWRATYYLCVKDAYPED
jgi:hypothetical protein